MCVCGLCGYSCLLLVLITAVACNQVTISECSRTSMQHLPLGLFFCVSLNWLALSWECILYALSCMDELYKWTTYLPPQLFLLKFEPCWICSQLFNMESNHVHLTDVFKRWIDWAVWKYQWIMRENITGFWSVVSLPNVHLFQIFICTTQYVASIWELMDSLLISSNRSVRANSFHCPSSPVDMEIYRPWEGTKDVSFCLLQYFCLALFFSPIK